MCNQEDAESREPSDRLEVKENLDSLGQDKQIGLPWSHPRRERGWMRVGDPGGLLRFGHQNERDGRWIARCVNPSPPLRRSNHFGPGNPRNRWTIVRDQSRTPSSSPNFFIR